MLEEYVFSESGRKLLQPFKEKYDCDIRINEPGSDLVVDVGNQTFRIPSSESVEDFKETVNKSMKTGINHVADRYKAFPVVYKKRLVY